jgi:hypothetical protein
MDGHHTSAQHRTSGEVTQKTAVILNKLETFAAGGPAGGVPPAAICSRGCVGGGSQTLPGG